MVASCDTRGEREREPLDLAEKRIGVAIQEDQAGELGL